MDKKQADFLLRELGVDVNTLPSMSDDEIVKLYDAAFDIETEEAVKCQDGDISERGAIAADVVDFLYDY